MSDRTRRSFLQHTLAVAAGAIANSAGRLEAADADAAPAARTHTADRIGLAIIGLHGRGLDHLDSYTFDDRVEIVALCDVDSATFGKAQRKLAERGRRPAKPYSDIRKLLEDNSVQAISIAVPNHWHALASIWAMQAGKDVYVEKPVSHTFAEGRRLEQARAKYGRICQAGLQSRSSTAHRQAIQYIHDGKIGKVTLARGLCYKRRKSIGHLADAPAPPGVDYDLWLGPAPQRPFNPNRFHYNWHWNWDYGNGDIGNQGVHQMDVARWALNKGLPSNALSFGGRFGYEDDGQTPNTQVAFFDYGDSHLLFEVRGLETAPVQELMVGTIVYGTEGFVAISNEDVGQAVAFDPKGSIVQRFKGSGNHFNNFITAVLNGRQSDLHCPILEGHLSSAMCHLANVSYRLGTRRAWQVEGPGWPFAEPVDLVDAFGRFEQHLQANGLDLLKLTSQMGPRLAFDPAPEHFVNHAQANSLLKGEYRQPFVMPEHF